MYLPIKFCADSALVNNIKTREITELKYFIKTKFKRLNTVQIKSKYIYKALIYKHTLPVYCRHTVNRLPINIYNTIRGSSKPAADGINVTACA